MSCKKQTKTNTAVHLTASDRTFFFLINIFLVFMGVIVAIPIWSTITQSVRPESFIGTNLEGMFLPLWKWSSVAYSSLLGNRGFLTAFINSLIVFILGVVSALVLTVPLAYVLSVKMLPGKKFLNIFILIPYLFNVGIIPTYLVVTGIGLTNHLSSIFLPGAISTYNCLIIRGFFESIPEELKESARIDGAPEWLIMIRVILPLSKPILMTIGLYYGVSFWNDFFRALLYINKDKLLTLPILLRNILMASGMNEYVEINAFGNASVQAIKAASVFLSAVPMVIAYPFIQKYFTKGTLMGSVKG